jgi:hypothetical protein
LKLDAAANVNAKDGEVNGRLEDLKSLTSEARSKNTELPGNLATLRLKNEGLGKEIEKMNEHESPQK